MNGSLSAHGGLTPGREGKGKEEEGKNYARRASSFTVTSVTRGPVIDR